MADMGNLMGGMRNFLKPQMRKQKQRYSEPCVECQRCGKDTRVPEPIVRCKNCQGALCRNHSTGIVMLGGPYKGMCYTCYTNTTKQSNKIIQNIRTAQKLLMESKNKEAELLIESITKELKP
jgi:hypothetical protein